MNWDSIIEDMLIMFDSDRHTIGKSGTLRMYFHDRKSALKCKRDLDKAGYNSVFGQSVVGTITNVFSVDVAKPIAIDQPILVKDDIRISVLGRDVTARNILEKETESYDFPPIDCYRKHEDNVNFKVTFWVNVGGNKYIVTYNYLEAQTFEQSLFDCEIKNVDGGSFRRKGKKQKGALAILAKHEDSFWDDAMV